MKFKLIIGNDPSDGVLQFENNPDVFINMNLTEQFDSKVWAISYDDELGINNIEYHLNGNPINHEDYGLPNNLTLEEASRYYEWCRTKYDALKARLNAERIIEQYESDKEQYTPWLSWDYSNSPKLKRDNLLALSDPYILLANLDGTGWESWRQWIRNLPQSYQRPIDIVEWRPLPSNASTTIITAYESFQSRIAKAKELSEQYADFVLPVLD